MLIVRRLRKVDSIQQVCQLQQRVYFIQQKNSQDALSEYYPHINAGMLTLRGGEYPKQQFTNALDYRDALMVGSPQQIIEKCFTNMNCLGNNALWHKLILVVYHLIKLRKTSN